MAGIHGPLARYAERFHRSVGDGHHVASPLGAWLLLALTAPASEGAVRAELEEVLGTDAATAADAAAALLDNPHPVVASAVALWKATVAGAGLNAWQASLPGAVEVGPLPDQAGADAWARDRTFGLIDSFPLELDPKTVIVLASALATKISWEVPFEVAPASALGAASPWAGRVSRVLRTPNMGHDAFIASTDRLGDVAVHVASTAIDWDAPARTGLSVVSVAADPEASAGDVLAAAYDISREVVGGNQNRRRSLFDLPLGNYPLWTIRDQPYGWHEEHHTAYLPCWSARSRHGLTAPAALGFGAAAEALARRLELDEARFDAAQTAMATYGRYGFEAAAVTGFAVAAGAPEPSVSRVAELRFGSPYAVVAVATDIHAGDIPGPWHGVPVFSAWVTEPEDLPESDSGDAPDE